MDAEYFEIEKEIVDEIKKTKASGRRVFSVGTTTTRAIEGYFSDKYSPIHPFAHSPICGYTNIFIYPGYEFRVVDSLITNFHLPRSTPLLLTSAFCSSEKLREAYRIAVSHKYRFFSYGDAMLIL
jgi:S-adenosylmethionine:tRNA ribosyltransferase-isomerase